MQVEKSQVAAVLRSRGDHDRAQQAECVLPQQVDTDRDAGLLHRFGVEIRDLTDGEPPAAD